MKDPDHIRAAAEAPPCGHTDGWCGGALGRDFCADRTPPAEPAPDEHGMDPEDLWEQRHGYPYPEGWKR